MERRKRAKPHVTVRQPASRLRPLLGHVLDGPTLALKGTVGNFREHFPFPIRSRRKGDDANTNEWSSVSVRNWCMEHIELLTSRQLQFPVFGPWFSL